jgi:muramoyltetrapeptide carboxypeptidase
LVPGDAVGVVTPGFAIEPERLRTGIARLESMGFRVVCGEHVLDRDGYFAGDDEARARDLAEMLDRRDVRAVWFARGGYGTARLLDRISLDPLARDPKLLVGYSDLTCLFAVAIRDLGLVCLHGPFVTELGDAALWHEPSLVEMLRGGSVEVPIGDEGWIARGTARGTLVGGNLTVLAHTIGTPHAPDVDGAVLFLEDVGEEAYRVDRLLTHLSHAGWLDRVAGVVLGSFDVPVTRRKFPPDRPFDDIVRERFASLGVPVASGVPVGHRSGKWTIPLGGTVEIDGRASIVRFHARS